MKMGGNVMKRGEGMEEFDIGFGVVEMGGGKKKVGFEVGVVGGVERVFLEGGDVEDV